MGEGAEDELGPVTSHPKLSSRCSRRSRKKIDGKQAGPDPGRDSGRDRLSGPEAGEAGQAARAGLRPEGRAIRGAGVKYSRFAHATFPLFSRPWVMTPSCSLHGQELPLQFSCVAFGRHRVCVRWRLSLPRSGGGFVDFDLQFRLSAESAGCASLGQAPIRRPHAPRPHPAPCPRNPYHSPRPSRRPK